MRHTPGMTAEAIVEEIMTQHWAPSGCRCWVCVEGRGIGCRARPRYMAHLRTTPERGYVQVDREPSLHHGGWHLRHQV